MATKKYIFILILVLLSFNTIEAKTPFFPKLVVSGSALLHKPADQVSLSVSVVTQGNTVDKALSDNNNQMDEVITSLQIAGLEKGEYYTGQFSVRPIHSTPPKNMPPEWKSQIIAYEVTNTITVKTQKLDLAPVIIDAAGTSGADQISNISFGLKDANIFRDEAITAATANALKDAESLASAANIKLVRILDIALDQPQIYQRPGQNMLYMAKAERAAFIEAPDVDISANVSVTFEIASRE